MARILFTSRHGGLGSDPYSNFNLGSHVGDDPLIVAKNRDALAHLFSVDQVVFMDQSHGVEIVEVLVSDQPTPAADALITRVKGIALAVLVADCLPLLLSSPSMVAAVHVGRRGLLAGIIQKVVECFPEDERSQMSAEIGPSICTRCYEVDEQTYKSAVAVIPELATNSQTRQLNLMAGARALLGIYGISVISHDTCTREHDNYFSYRRNSITGRQAGVIAL